jgi:hypothetical protein
VEVEGEQCALPWLWCSFQLYFQFQINALTVYNWSNKYAPHTHTHREGEREERERERERKREKYIERDFRFIYLTLVAIAKVLRTHFASPLPPPPKNTTAGH